MILDSLKQRIKKLFKQNKPYSYFIASLILVVFVYMALKIEVLERSFFLSSNSVITISYTQYLINAATIILKLTNHQVNVDYIHQTIQVIGSMPMGFNAC